MRQKARSSIRLILPIVGLVVLGGLGVACSTCQSTWFRACNRGSAVPEPAREPLPPELTHPTSRQAQPGGDPALNAPDTDADPHPSPVGSLPVFPPAPLHIPADTPAPARIPARIHCWLLRITDDGRTVSLTSTRCPPQGR